MKSHLPPTISWQLQERRLTLKLDFLQQGREKLIQDFLEKNPEIYYPCFQYEQDTQLMQLAIEKYFTSWLSYHWQIVENLLQVTRREQGLNDEVKKALAETMLALLRKWNLQNREQGSSDLQLNLLNEKVNFLEELIQAGDKFSYRFAQLKFEHARDKAFFDRQIDKLQGEGTL